MPAQVDAGRDDREHAGRPHGVGRNEREVARDEGDRHFDRRVVESAPNRGDDKADDEADRNSAADAPQQAPRRVPDRERAGDGCRDRHPVEDECGAVVHEALALHDRDSAARHAQPAHDRGRRDRIRRRDHCSQHERGRPRHVVDERVSHSSDRDHRREHEPDREETDRTDIRP